MTHDELLTAYDDQLRTNAEVARAHEVERLGPLLCAVFDHGGFVSYRDLGGLDGDHLDALVERVVAHYRDDTDVDSFEWKSRGHDLPADLGARLTAHGLAAEPVETVMIGEASSLAVDVPLEDTPEGPVVVRRSGSPPPTRRHPAHVTRCHECSAPHRWGVELVQQRYSRAARRPGAEVTNGSRGGHEPTASR